MSRAFVITTSVNGNSRSKVWDPSVPLSIGHPFKWVIERTASGVRVRNIDLPLNEVQTSAVREISAEMIARGETITLPQADPAAQVSFQIRPIRALAAPFANSRPSESGELQVYACMDTWMLQATRVGESFTGRVHGEEAFVLSRDGAQGKDTCYRVQARIEGLVLRTQGAEKALASGSSEAISAGALATGTISMGAMVWRFGTIESIELPVSKGDSRSAEENYFLNAVKGAGAGVGVLILLAMLWPKADPKQEELVPAQFTQIVMAKPKQGSTQAAPAQAAASGSKSATRAKDTAVVQAFRAKALQSAVKGLLKGGMTTLLAQSDFTAGASASANSRLFNSKSEALRATSPGAGTLAAHDVKAGTLGGAGQGVNGGKGVGYASGEKAGVTGQGQAFVSMDIAGAGVQEGLTKDEVGEVIHRHLSEVRYCYESAMLRTPDIEGKLMVNFTINGSGNVKSADVQKSTLPDPRLDDCILRRLMSWKFPNPKGGVDVAVTYPFIFKTLGR